MLSITLTSKVSIQTKDKTVFCFSKFQLLLFGCHTDMRIVPVLQDFQRLMESVTFSLFYDHGMNASEGVLT